MITEKIRIYLRTISEGHHSRQIATILNIKGVIPKRSNAYTSRTIKRIFDGDQEDIPAELEIIEYYEQLKIKISVSKNLYRKIENL